MNILIIEDHPLYRGALVNLLRTVAGSTGVAEAASAEEGLQAVEALAGLRLILLDLGLPSLNGVEAIAAFRALCPRAALIVVSATENRRIVADALRAGADAFVSKGAPQEELLDIARRALAGALPEPEWITPTGASLGDAATDPIFTLTPRQHEVLNLLVSGLSNKEIGRKLDLAEITVKIHVSSIFRRLDVTNRTRAVAEARRIGLLPPD